MKIAVFNGKGGVGKSTIAANLAVLANCTLLDADPQATCCYWHDRRKTKQPEVLDVSLGRVGVRIQGLDRVVVDLPGATVPGIQEALKAVDTIVIPVTYDQACIDALPVTLELIHSCNRRSVIVLNRIHPRTTIELISETFTKLESTICPHPLRERVGHRDWWAKGEVAADHLREVANQEVKSIWQWLQNFAPGN
ncbi:MAG: ParA family protein [Microcoleus sp. SM1_3_4]|nr:ParA family protein [Microcoleus sp. SM1_3_4]